MRAWFAFIASNLFILFSIVFAGNLIAVVMAITKKPRLPEKTCRTFRVCANAAGACHMVACCFSRGSGGGGAAGERVTIAISSYGCCFDNHHSDRVG